jgi:hypothetical protein
MFDSPGAVPLANFTTRQTALNFLNASPNSRHNQEITQPENTNSSIAGGDGGAHSSSPNFLNLNLLAAASSLNNTMPSTLPAAKLPSEYLPAVASDSTTNTLQNSSVSTVEAAPLSNLQNVGPNLKRKYTEKQLSGRQKEQHHGPVDTYTKKQGAALAQSKNGRLETLFTKATTLNRISALDISILVRDHETISTHFTNSRTAAIIRPKLGDLYNCDLLVKTRDESISCNIFNKGNNKKFNGFEVTGEKATISLDPEYALELKRKNFASRWSTINDESTEGKLKTLSILTNFAFQQTNL